jgi:hypothetical protein
LGLTTKSCYLLLKSGIAKTQGKQNVWSARMGRDAPNTNQMTADKIYFKAKSITQSKEAH